MKVITPKDHFKYVRWFIYSLPFLALLWVIRPWFHGFVMGFYKNPLILQALIIWVILKYTVLKKRGTPMQFHTATGTKSIMVDMSSLLIFVFVLFISPIFSSLMPELHLADELQFNQITALPETPDNIRLMPYEVAYRYSKDSLQLSQFRLGTENIANIDGKLSWMFPLIPDGGILSFIKQNAGVVAVDATSQGKTTKLIEKDLAIGQGMQITDNLWWRLYKARYLVEFDDPFYIPVDGEVYTVASVIQYSYHHFFGLMYAVPRFGGVAIADSKGGVRMLSPEEAQKDPLLKNNRLFPENLARYYAQSYVYHKGLINKLFIHEDQIDIQDVPGTRSRRNYQPYLMDTADGLKWFISAEPYGESHGIFKIFLIDAASGRIDLYSLPTEESLTGPIKVRDFVRRANPVVDWNRFSIMEPLPIVQGNQLYWKVVIAPSDAAGIAYHAFVNAKTNEVLEFEEESQVRAFVTGEEVVEEIIPDVSETNYKEQIVAQINQKMDEIKVLLESLE